MLRTRGLLLAFAISAASTLNAAPAVAQGGATSSITGVVVDDDRMSTGPGCRADHTHPRGDSLITLCPSTMLQHTSTNCRDIHNGSKPGTPPTHHLGSIPFGA